MSELTFITLPEVLRRKGGGKSTLYAEIKEGYFPRPVKLGLRHIGWPEHEIDAVMQFFLRGESQAELKAFIRKLETNRIHEGV